ncbi:F-box protein CPR1-like [Carya illinoinensis]|uniref:F-box associated beta-propeller type 1 domain-containing protein n=1 Tax=Carya illinoinensis TaxID=32201 RepID=A0A8T1PW40_CARIL|nr:F-box protein CPR1-like [Carya illinoinensis]KAG6645621.1 hypothetical protein CIPAW_08G134800 [Carya illinoinensis]
MKRTDLSFFPRFAQFASYADMFSLNRERPLCYVRTGFSINAKFPPYLIYEILLLLPIKPLLRFQCLSHQYRALINSPFFITEHLESSKATDRERALIALECDIVRPDCCSVPFHDDDRFGRAVQLYYPLPLRHREIQLVGYSNGLVTLHDSDYVIVIWNPLIRKYKQLPFEPIENPHGSNAHRLPSLAFGHDVVNDDYKVFRIVQFKERYVDGLASEVKVYSLRAQSWKRINDEWPTKFFSVISDSASLNGALHWFVGPFDIEHNRQLLIGFDLATEKFREYAIPIEQDNESEHSLGVLGDWLCVCQNVYATHSHFWVMKEYGVESSWTRLYTISLLGVANSWKIRCCKPLALSKNGEKVLVQPDDKKPFWYDMKEKRIEKVGISPLPCGFETAICVESLVLLDGDR